MIKKLKTKFTILATVSVFVLMTVLVGSMNILNYSSTLKNTDITLDMLSKNTAPLRDKAPHANDNKPFIDLPDGMSPEVPYESRYFSVSFSEDGEIIETDISRIVSVAQEEAEKYAEKAFSENTDRGFVGNFRYLKKSDNNNIRITFLDCGRKLDAFDRFLWISITIGFIGCIAVFFVFLFASEKIVRPIAESYEKQKRFITDAGHEMKTPLTIISANIDLLESDFGENESLTDIKHQTKRLSALTSDLVYLARMEEAENNLQKIDFPLSDLISETAYSFGKAFRARGKSLSCSVEPAVTMKGSPDAIRQLISVLLENALKYSKANTVVTVEMFTHGKTIRISVFNETSEFIDSESLSHLFDRFYRTDSSRNSSTGGYGIGLSIAHAITLAHGGKITAASSNGFDFRINLTFPM